jgi:hypothetical protein
MTCPVIDNPTSCGNPSLCAAVYSQNVMSEGTVKRWYRMYKDGRK